MLKRDNAKLVRSQGVSSRPRHLGIQRTGPSTLNLPGLDASTRLVGNLLVVVRTGLLQSSTRGVHLLPNPRLKKNLHPTTFLPLCSCFCFLGLTGTGSLCFTGTCEEICNLKQSTRAHQATCLRRPAGHRVGLISVLEMPENLKLACEMPLTCPVQRSCCHSFGPVLQGARLPAPTTCFLVLLELQARHAAKSGPQPK